VIVGRLGVVVLCVLVIPLCGGGGGGVVELGGVCLYPL
jgi:hypothetical protein